MAFLHLENLTNVSYCVMEVVKDGNIVFNTTQPFNMSNFGTYEPLDVEDPDSSSSSEPTSSSSTYVASSDSNKFHEPYCSQAQRIKDSNKITFSSRNEAINAGYEPCEICYP